MTNTLGKTVYILDKINVQQEASDSYRIELSFLPSGVYFVRIQNDAEQKIFKIVKE